MIVVTYSAPLCNVNINCVSVPMHCREALVVVEKSIITRVDVSLVTLDLFFRGYSSAVYDISCKCTYLRTNAANNLPNSI